MKDLSAVVAVSLCVCSGTSFGDVFVDESEFIDAIDVVHTNPLDDVFDGTALSLEYSSGAYSYTMEAVGPGGGILSTRDGEVSTTSGLDGILITFTGADVTAVGGHFWATAGEGETIGGYLSLSVNGGDSILFSSTGPDNFRGLTSDTAINSLFVEMPDGSVPLWATMSSLVIGQTVPAPGGFALLGLGGIFAGRRRR